MRKPKDLDLNYDDACKVAGFLERVARNLRDYDTARPFVKAMLKLSFWNPEWEKNGGGMTGVTLVNKQ